MQKMKQRFVKLMREMDQNSKLIEEETKEYYVEFLKKWREVAKQRILMHRKNTEALIREKEHIEQNYKTKLGDLNQQLTEANIDRSSLRQKLLDDIKERDAAMEFERLQSDQALESKDQEISQLKDSLA